MKQKDSESYGFILVAIGLLIGFFLGGSIVYWYTNKAEDHLITDRALNTLSRLFQATDIDESNSDQSLLTETIHKPEIIPTQKLSFTTEDSIISDGGDLTISNLKNDLDTTSISEIIPFFEDTTLTPIISESSPHIIDQFNTSNYSSSQSTEGIRIIKDQFIGTKGFYLPEYYMHHALSEGSQILDSLIGNVRMSQRNRRVLYVEFWESPLNYTAYRMTKNRIIIYGLNQLDLVSLNMIDNSLYLKYYEDYFPLDLTADFSPLIPVSDVSLINKLEQQWP
jgi:hypothetical protein